MASTSLVCLNNLQNLLGISVVGTVQHDTAALKRKGQLNLLTYCYILTNYCMNSAKYGGTKKLLCF